MIEKTLKEIQEMSKGSGLLDKFNDIKIKGVSTDTRKIKERQVFVPLVGENFNGHNFIDKAIEEGAAASLWQKDIPLPDIDFPFILVEDTLKGLQDLARSYRESLKETKFIGITGSNGKTTSKDILDGVLSTKFKTQKTQGNLNNHIGVPLTILSLEEDTEVAIVEMGTDGFGQIEELTYIAQPHIGAITNIGDSHLVELKTKDNIARAKYEILKGINEDGHFIYNGDDPILVKIASEFSFPEKLSCFGQEDKNDFKLKLLEETNNSIKFNFRSKNLNKDFILPMIGRHNIYNAGLAIIIALDLGLNEENIQKGFYNIDKTGMRNELIQKDNFTILNDAYKSNPNSLRAALDTLYALDGYDYKYVVLGDMLDLGDKEKDLHREIGENINEKQVDKLYTYGDLSKNIQLGAKSKLKDSNNLHFDSKSELAKQIKEDIKDNTIILVKASRSIQLEDLISELIK